MVLMKRMLMSHWRKKEEDGVKTKNKINQM